MTADRIPHSQITSLVTARPCYPAQAALFAALTGINTAERTMREKITFLRTALDNAGAILGDHHRQPDSYLTGRIERAAGDLDRASTACAIHWQTARALLTEAELQTLATPPKPPGTPGNPGKSRKDTPR
jgi:hypothetical protein